MTQTSPSSWPLIRRILKDYIQPQWLRIVYALFFMGIVSGMTAAQAYLLEPIINKIFVGKQAEYLIPIGLSIIAVFLLRGFGSWAQNILMAYVGQDIVAKIQSQIFHRLIRQDIAFFQKHNAGSLSSLLISDVTMMRMALSDTLTGFGRNILTLVFLIAVMFHQDWKMSLLAFVIFPPAGLLVSGIGRKLRQVAKSTQEEQSTLSGLLNQSFMGIRQVKAYNAEDHEDDRIRWTLSRIIKLSNKAVRVASIAMPISELLSGVAIAIIIYYGGLQVIHGVSTPGRFFSFVGAFLMAYEPLKRLAKINAGLQIGLASAGRVFNAIDIVPEIQDAPNAQSLSIKEPTVIFDNVSFTYPDGTIALNNISFTAKAGQKTALVGPSGSGKTTCLQLLLRFYETTSGRILIDGHDIRSVTQKSLREALAFVSQDVFIFDDSVTNNIAYARPNASAEDVRKAAQKAAAEDFIAKLENCYETRVGEMGTKLSGGQKQRLAIARAILKDAPILLLDEATSALDTKSEEFVTRALNDLEKGRTTLVIAHRLSTIRDADQIIVMDQGRVVATGSHDSLMTQGGLYPSLYATMTT
jgi:subfamily B ATP-binding cassette protein MsbA